VRVRDGVRDNRPQVEVANREAPEGNHVVLRLATGERLLLAHLRRGSVRVRPGQRVRAGAPLGRVGNSGNSSEPHMHLHAQTRGGTGVPVAFRRLLVDGVRRQGAVELRLGRFVRSR
jgi:murein DD-endopeptidase MepM/ murein hydrolase activator NlpD